MKKLLLSKVIIAIIVVSMCSISVFATPPVGHSTGAGIITDEYLDSIQDEVETDRIRRRHQINEKITTKAFGDGEWTSHKKLNIKLIEQEKWNYCGPACMQMAYHSMTGYLVPTQDYYAKKLGIYGKKVGSYPSNNGSNNTTITYWDPNYAAPGPAIINDTYENVRTALSKNGGVYLY